MSIKQHQVDALLFGLGAYAADQGVPRSDTDRLLVLIRAAMPIMETDPEMAANTVAARRSIRAQVDSYRASIMTMVLAQKISIETGDELSALADKIMSEDHGSA